MKVQVKANPVVKKEVENIDVPDLWHVAMAIREGRDFSTQGKDINISLSEMILETWHLAHSLKAHIQLTK